MNQPPFPDQKSQNCQGNRNHGKPVRSRNDGNLTIIINSDKLAGKEILEISASFTESWAKEKHTATTVIGK
jgi:hypothetical protein